MTRKTKTPEEQAYARALREEASAAVAAGVASAADAAFGDPPKVAVGGLPVPADAAKAAYPVSLMHDGPAQAHVATASGFVHAVARDLDLLISGISGAKDRKALVELIEKKVRLLNLAAENLERACVGIEREDRKVSDHGR